MPRSLLAIFKDLIKWFNNMLLPLLRHLFLIPNKINIFMDHETCFISSFNQFCQNLVVTWRFILFRPCNRNFNHKGVCSAVCTSTYLTSLMLFTFNSLLIYISYLSLSESRSAHLRNMLHAALFSLLVL